MARPTRSKRLTTGCLTCRVRKIKCDEARPECKKCTSTGRKCDGYSALPFSRGDLQAASRSNLQFGLVPTILADASFRDVAEKRYFQFFRDCTVAGTNLMVDSRFWDRVVLQISHAEPAVRHIILALGSLHNSTLQRDDQETCARHLSFAEKEYQKALVEARLLVETASSQQVDRVLIVCGLFVLYEGIRGNYQASQIHMNSARAIMSQESTSSRTTSQKHHYNEIVGLMARLDLFALTFSDETAPYQYTLANFLRTNPSLRIAPFHNMYQVSAILVDILRWILILGDHIIAESKAKNLTHLAYLQKELERGGEHLQKWRQQWNTWLAKNIDVAVTLQAKSIELWFTMAEVMVETGFTGPQTRFDDFQSHFVHMVDLGEQLSRAISQKQNLSYFSLDLGFIIPIFFPAIRCRDPVVRRRAVSVLELCPRYEGIWESTAAAAIARQWIEMEEKGLEVVTSAADIPEDNRITAVHAEVDIDRLLAGLRFEQYSPDWTNQAVQHKEVGWSRPNCD